MPYQYQRYLTMDLPVGQSVFLWGARKTGKSMYLKNNYPDSIYYDLLNTDVYWRLLKQPSLLREEVLALSEQDLVQPIVIDEVQRVPELLNEVHWLIENTAAYFILCGSSARKLKREGANLLGGRAWRYEFYPLVYPELPEFDLLRALQRGLVPSHYDTIHWRKSIKAYIQDYLHEEIKAEGLTRNLVAFAHFLDIIPFSNGELINFSNIARDCGIDAKTVKEYYQILVDTLLGYYLLPYQPRKKRVDIVATPKFYFFDVGVVNVLASREILELKGQTAGAALEHYILMELIAQRGLNDLEHKITYWRNKSGLEVDFVLGEAQIGIEVKIAETVHTSDVRGLLTFQETFKPKHCYVVCLAQRRRKITTAKGACVEVLPWQTFLKMLWQGEIIRTKGSGRELTQK